jgi:hypothetical protein
VIKQKAQNFVRTIAEKRDHTQKKEKKTKRFLSLTWWGSNVLSNEVTQES